MYSKELEKQVKVLFEGLKTKAVKIVSESRKNTDATNRIMRLVSSTISAEAEGYIVDMYDCLVKKIKQEDFFKNHENMNAFYRLNLRDELNNKYQFNIENIDAYKNGIEYKEINQLYRAACAAIGTLAVGEILKRTLAGVVNIPFVVVIAGALATACTSYFTLPTRNRKKYIKALDKFMNDLENDILNWFVDVEVYFDNCVRELYK